MRKALLQRLAGEAASSNGSPIGRSVCAPATTTPTTLPTGVLNVRAIGSAPMPKGAVGGACSVDDATSASMCVDDAACNLEATRCNHLSTKTNETTPVAEVTDARHADGSAGTAAQAEAARLESARRDVSQIF
jgi:hypothetical protein